MQSIAKFTFAVLATASFGGALFAGTFQSVTNAAPTAMVTARVLDTPELFKYRDKTVAFEITAAGHATASYVSAPYQRIISVAVIRGGENDLQVDPDAPPYALDIRISDNENIVLAAQSGSGHFVDQTWDKELKVAPLAIDDEKREGDVAELAYFADVLRAQVQPRLSKSRLTQWAWEVDELISLMNYVEAQSGLGPTRHGESWKATATYSNVVTIKKKTAFGIIFEHSSLSDSLYSNRGSLLYTVVTCNHGTCANSSLMSTKCSKTFTQSTVDAWASDLLCDFYGSPYPVHVCNNDTRAEYLSIKNRSRGTWSSCSRPILYAPSCD